MAKMYVQKARKTYICSKCGATINKGDTYYKIEAMYSPTRYRCSHCKPERSELTNSEYLAWLFNLQDHLEECFDLRYDGIAEELIDEIGGMKDELESRLENMPEQLRDADTGTVLQERIESLEDAISELENVEYPDYDTVVEDACDDDEEELDEDAKNAAFQEALDEFESSIIDIINGIE